MKKLFFVMSNRAFLCSAQGPLTHKYDCGGLRFEIIAN